MFTEVILDKEDSSKELIQFGCKISARRNPPNFFYFNSSIFVSETMKIKMSYK